jgi:hypothetical protein
MFDKILVKLMGLGHVNKSIEGDLKPDENKDQKKKAKADDQERKK